MPEISTTTAAPTPRRNIRRVVLWTGLLALSLLIIAVACQLRASGWPRATITIDTNGSARLGMIPLKNKTVRNLTLRTLARIQSTPVSIEVPRAARFDKVVEVMDVMKGAGITSVVLRTDQDAKK
jgi:hypothetical protein